MTREELKKLLVKEDIGGGLIILHFYGALFVRATIKNSPLTAAYYVEGPRLILEGEEAWKRWNAKRKAVKNN